MQKKKLKANTFLQGAFIATFGIVLSKIMGIIYVIPFYGIVGEQGGALYGYAYNIYSIFLSISTAGIPLAISSITSEYNTLEYYSVKERLFRITKRYLNIVGIACFIILFIFAREIAYLIIGDISGGNSIGDITFVIRCISFSILIVPMLSVYRGYLQGHKYITSTSISQVLEQLIRVSIIIIGSYVAVRVFNLPIKYAVSTALLGATIGSFFSLLYLIIIRRKHSSEIKKELTNEVEKTITNKMILKKVLICAFPFIFCDVAKSLYNSVDTFFVVKTLVNIGYSVNVSEVVMGVISTWGNKLNMIIVAVGTGFFVSLIPNLAASMAKKDMKDVEEKINLAMSSIGYLVIPMALGLSFLNKPVWSLFYGASEYGPVVFRFSVIASIFVVLSSMTIIVAFSMKEYKILYIGTVAGLLFNAIFDIPLMYFCELFKMGYYGATLSTCLGYLLSVSIILITIKKRHDFNFSKARKNIISSIICSILMILSLFCLSLIININTLSKLKSLFIVVLFTLFGGFVYLILTYKFKVIENVFGKERCDVVLNRLKNIKKRVIK